MSGQLRLSVIIDGQTREATVAVNQVTDALKKLEGEARTAGPATAAAMRTAGQGAAQAAQLSTQQLAGMQFQLQDIMVGLTSGQSPFTVMMQQGSQLAQSFQSGTGVRAALASVGQGIVQFLTNPLNLAVVGFGLAASAAGSFFSAVNGAANSTEGALERHEELVNRIKGAYDNTTLAVKAYADETRNTLLADALRDQFNLARQMRQQTTGLITEGRPGLMIGGVVVPRGENAYKDEIAAAVQTLRQGIRDGIPDIKTFVDQLAKIEIAAGPESSAAQLARSIREANKELLDLSTDYKQSNDIVKALRDGNKGLNEALGEGTKKVDSLVRSLGNIPEAINGYGPRSPFAGAPPAFSGKALLDLIGAAEGTDRGRGYNETLGYGKFTGGPVDLVTMSLRQVIDLQTKMLADPANTFNSSAVGRYQITRETLQDFMPRLGLDQNTIFTPDVQDKIALAIAQAAGRSTELLQGRWEGLKRVASEDILSAFDGAGKGRAGTVAAMAEVEAERERLRISQETREQKKQELEIHRQIGEQTKKQAADAREAQRTALEMQRDMAAFTDQFRGLGDGLVSAIAQARAAGESWTSSFSTGLDMLSQKGLSFLDRMIDKALDLALLGPEGTSGGGLLGSLLGGFGSLLNPMQNALGNAFHRGSVIPFATGGVISSPTLFPLRGGTGLMGEAGPEAIMPLTRGPGGHLGVRALGGGGAVSGARPEFRQTIINNAGAEVSSRATPNASGGLDIETVIDQMVQRSLSKPDTASMIESRFGLKPQVRPWG